MDNKKRSSVKNHIYVGDKVLCPIFIGSIFARVALGDVIFVNDFYCTVEITVDYNAESCFVPMRFDSSCKEKYCITFDFLQVRSGYVQKICPNDVQELSKHIDVLGNLFYHKSIKNMRKILELYNCIDKGDKKCTHLGIA